MVVHGQCALAAVSEAITRIRLVGTPPGSLPFVTYSYEATSPCWGTARHAGGLGAFSQETRAKWSWRHRTIARTGGGGPLPALAGPAVGMAGQTVGPPFGSLEIPKKTNNFIVFHVRRRSHCVLTRPFVLLEPVYCIISLIFLQPLPSVFFEENCCNPAFFWYCTEIQLYDLQSGRCFTGRVCFGHGFRHHPPSNFQPLSQAMTQMEDPLWTRPIQSPASPRLHIVKAAIRQGAPSEMGEGNSIPDISSPCFSPGSLGLDIAHGQSVGFAARRALWKSMVLIFPANHARPPASVIAECKDRGVPAAFSSEPTRAIRSPQQYAANLVASSSTNLPDPRNRQKKKTNGEQASRSAALLVRFRLGSISSSSDSVACLDAAC